jgi:hypothetical protein
LYKQLQELLADQQGVLRVCWLLWDCTLDKPRLLAKAEDAALNENMMPTPNNAEMVGDQAARRHTLYVYDQLIRAVLLVPESRAGSCMAQ